MTDNRHWCVQQAARIAELEAEVNRLNEAGKVLAREVVKYATIEAAKHGEQYSTYYLPMVVVDNPTAAAWVREVSNAK